MLAPSDLVAKLNAADAQYVPRPCEVIDFGAARLRIAVGQAIIAYRKTGRMMDAALAYAAFGLPVFPLDVNSKRPIPRRIKKQSGTGGVYRATTNPLQIIAWWRETPKALIGLPMGERSGVWCLDIDTAEDHHDGTIGWGKLAAQHDPIVTREHRSATGGPHLLFVWTEAMPIRCSKGELPSGIDVMGSGGYIAVPPSVRKQRSYSVHSDIDPVPAPQWLIDLILQGRCANGTYFDPAWGTEVDFDELRDAMQFVPNNDLDWDDWTAHLLALFAACGNTAKGFALADEWSSRSCKYDAAYTRQRWREIKGSPPDRTGVNKLLKIARENGWAPRLCTLPADNSGNITPKPDATLDVAREQLKHSVFAFLDRVAVPESELSDPYTRLYFDQLDADWPLVKAIAAPTGLGKTRIAVAELAQWMRSTGAGPVAYAVPRHKLGLEVVEQFSTHGLNARMFYGRDYPDPGRHDPSKSEDEQTRMCVNGEVVKTAMLARADISETCCISGKKRCLYFGSCGYTRQQEDAEQVQVWIVASDMLFHTHKVFEKSVAVIVDESFWAKGLRGIGHNDCSIPLASLQQKHIIDLDSEEGERDYLRGMLGNMLAQQEENGPIARQYLERTTTPAFKSKGKNYRPQKATLTPNNCTRAIHLEWHLIPKFPLKPGMSLNELASKCDVEKTIDAIRLARNIITIWQALREVLCDPEIETAGRLLLQQNNGLREVRWRGVAEVKLWLPTLLLDATLPDQSILQVYHPQVEVVPDLSVAMPPSVRIKQVLDAPTSANKLGNEKHLHALRRYILQRWLETGRGKTLIVTQFKAERWLTENGLPKNVHVEHFNAITGMDIYRDVRLLIIAGRTAPGPDAIETMAGALTGRQPSACPPAANGFRWYERQERGIHVRDGRRFKTISDAHPDAVAEAVRWLVHEGELVQAIGRGRGLNRSPECPLDIDLLVDTALPITVDEVARWRTPSLLAETASEGVMLTSPVDLMKLWPKLWPNRTVADRTLRQGVPNLPGFTEVAYQPKGPRMKRRTAWFDLGRIQDPYAWIAYRLGPIKPL